MYMTGYDEEKSLLMSQKRLEKRFGQSPVFIAATFMEMGGIPPSTNPATLLKEAIHVISCGYEDKTEWGKEVLVSLPFHLSISHIYRDGNQHFYIFSFELYASPFFVISSDRLDLRLCHGGYLNRVQDARPWLDLGILYASSTGVQGVRSDQSVGSSEPGPPVGPRIHRDYA